MPKQTKAERVAAEAAAALAQRIDAAIAALPFSPEHANDAPEAYGNLADDVRKGVALAILRDFRQLGLSGDELRGKYAGPAEAHAKGRGLTGHRRRKVFEEFGVRDLGVSRSYDEYADRKPRKGSGHARTHGALAQQRAADAAKALAEESAAAATLAEARKALRAAGQTVPTVRKGDEAPLRAAYAALLLAGSASVA